MKYKTTQPISPTYSNIWVVSGRIPYTDEDETYLIQAESREDAFALFEHLLYEFRDDVSREDNQKEFGQGCFVNMLHPISELHVFMREE